jgi:hypothetical protein
VFISNFEKGTNSGAFFQTSSEVVEVRVCVCVCVCAEDILNLAENKNTRGVWFNLSFFDSDKLNETI